MLKINGKLISKSIIKTGKNERGEWRVIEFVIEKTYNKKKRKVAFTAIGKNADLVNNIEYKERITVTFFPECFYSEKHNKHFTELKAVGVEKYVKRNIQDVIFNGEKLNQSDYELKRDNQLPFTQSILKEIDDSETK